MTETATPKTVKWRRSREFIKQTVDDDFQVGKQYFTGQKQKDSGDFLSSTLTKA